MNRLASLDYLRGLAAFGIMVFHYTMWTMGEYGAGDFLGRVGIYGVAVFYILSGITLYHVYYECIGSPSKKGLIDFAVKRVARIFPLLWLMTIATLVLKKEYYPTETIVLNFTGLFGLYHWGDTICYGAWSIGNELVFYLFFPVFVFLSKKSALLLSGFSVLLAIIFLWFTFRVMDSTKPLTHAGLISYINPLNQVFLFLGGYLIGHFTKNIQLPRQLTIPLIIFSVLVFIFYPVTGDVVLLISGFDRVVFTLASMLLCLAFYKTGARLPGLLHRFFSMLGEVSYSVYLSHPLTAFVISRILKSHFANVSLPVLISSCIICTIVVSYLTYRFFEKPFMSAGKYLAKKITAKAA